MTQEEIVERPLGVLVMAVINAAVSVTFAARLPAAIDSFREMFAGFGSDLGAPTKLVLGLPYVWVLFALVAIALLVWVATNARTTRARLRIMRISVRSFIVVFGLCLGFTTWAIYLPIFKMGQAV